MPTSTDFSLAEIGQIAVNVHDIETATAFYRDVLSMPFLFDAGTMAFFQCGDVRLMLAQPESDEFDHPASIIYYKVPDIEVAFQTLSDRGVTFEREPIVIHKTDTTELWMAFFRDLDKNLLALMAEQPVS